MVSEKELIESLVQDRGGQLNTIEVGELAFKLRKQVSPTLKERGEGKRPLGRGSPEPRSETRD